MARWAPTSDSTVRSIRSSRAWVSTEICTSSGIRSSSMSLRTKSKSVWLGAREADLDLLVAHRHQQLEHLELAGGRHRVDQRLVAVAQVGGQPARRLLDLLGRPGAVGHVDGHERRVAGERHRARALLVGGVAQVGHEFLGCCVSEGRPARATLRNEGAGVRPRCGGEGGEAAHHDGTAVAPSARQPPAVSRW